MRISVIKQDGLVGKDGLSFSNLDLSFLPSNIRAFQWYDTYGEIEFERFVENGKLVIPENEFVTVEPSWFSSVIAAWDIGKQAKDEFDARSAAELLAEQANPVNTEF